MTFNRSTIFTEAWTLARTRARKSGQPIRAMFKLALSVVWAMVKEAARKAVLPVRPNAWTMGAACEVNGGMFGGGNLRAHRSASIYNGW
jgi:hypothetical protein